MSEETTDSGKRLALGEGIGRTLAETVDLTDPAHRIAGALFVVLKNQLELLGYQPDTVPFDSRFGSEECRGALLGTAIAVAAGHREAPEHEHYKDAIAGAFMLVFGEQIGRAKGLETMEDAAGGNKAITFAAERARQDTFDTWSDDSPSMPMAFYHAAMAAR